MFRKRRYKNKERIRLQDAWLLKTEIVGATWLPWRWSWFIYLCNEISLLDTEAISLLISVVESCLSKKLPAGSGLRLIGVNWGSILLGVRNSLNSFEDAKLLLFTTSQWQFSCSGILAIDTPRPRNSALHHLTKQLLQKYHKDVRPVHDWTEATTVYLDVFVRAVLDVVRTSYPFLFLLLWCTTVCCFHRSLGIVLFLRLSVEIVGGLC